jgi:hypothetical protein
MSESTDGGPAPEYGRPLQIRTRPAPVAAQLAALSRLSRSAALRRAAETDPARRLERETLVAAARAFRRAGDQAAAGRVVGALIARVRPAVRAKVNAWAPLLPPDREDAEAQAILALAEYVNCLEPKEELWECNFVAPFRLRLITVLKGLTRRRVPTTSLTSEEGDERDDLPDPRAALAFTAVELREAILALDGHIPRMGEYLYLSQAGLTDRECAARLGVTDRTLRHWRARAQALLAGDTT